MKKNGQLYLLSALIIAFVVFLLLSPSNMVRKTVTDSRFESLSENFDRESARFLNMVIEDKENVETQFLNFTILFTSYSKTRNPDFGLLYGFIRGNMLYVGNYLSEDATVQFEGSQYDLSGCFKNINTTFSIAGLDIDIKDIDVAQFLSCQETINVRGSPPYLLDMQVDDADNPLSFTVELPQGHPELVIVAEEKRDLTKKVYSKGKFM